MSEDDRLGLLKIIGGSNSTILGASIVGEWAGENITEIAVAMRNGLKLSDLAAARQPKGSRTTQPCASRGTSHAINQFVVGS